MDFILFSKAPEFSIRWLALNGEDNQFWLPIEPPTLVSLPLSLQFCLCILLSLSSFLPFLSLIFDRVNNMGLRQRSYLPIHGK